MQFAVDLRQIRGNGARSRWSRPAANHDLPGGGVGWPGSEEYELLTTCVWVRAGRHVWRYSGGPVRDERKHLRGKKLSGAGYGDRTRLTGLGSQGITTMLSPRAAVNRDPDSTAPTNCLRSR